MLKAKLAELERQKRAEELDDIRGGKQNVGFGSQIRSYVLHPYQMVKDLRSEFETGNVSAVLDGDIDDAASSPSCGGGSVVAAEGEE